MLLLDHHRRLQGFGFILCLFVASIANGSKRVIADELGDLFSSAAQSFNAHDYETARQQLREVLEQSASNGARIDDDRHELVSEATFFMAEALVGLGEYSSAIEYYSDYLTKYGPGQRFGRQAMFRRGEGAYLAKENQRATRWLSEFLAEHPKDPLLAYALPYLGDLKLRDGNFEESAGYYRRAMEEFPAGPLEAECRFGLARSAEAAGDIEAARRRYQDMVGAADQRLCDLAGLHLGLLEYNAGDFTSAEKVFGDVVRDHPRTSYLTVIHYWRGLSQLALGAYLDAAESLDSVAAETAHSLAPPASYYSGEALRMAKQFGHARERYRQVRQEWPDSTWIDDSLCGELAVALATSDWETLSELFEQFEQNHRLSPRLAAARRDYVRGLLRQRQFTQVIRLLQPHGTSILKVGSDVGSGRLATEDEYLLAAAFFGDRQYEKVLEVTGSVELGSDRDERGDSLDLLRASSYLGLKRFADAETPLRRYLKRHDEGVGAARCRGQLAVALARQGQFEAATAAYEQYVTRDPRHAARLRTTQHLAAAARDAGRHNLARRWYEVLADSDNPAPLRDVAYEGLAWCRSRKTQADSDAGNRAAAQDVESDVAGGVELGLVVETNTSALARAMALDASGQLAEAKELYQGYRDRPIEDPCRPEALLGLAKIFESESQFTRETEVLKQFLTDYPNHPRHADATYQAAWCLVERDRWEEAKTLFAQLQRDQEGAFWEDATYRLAQRAAVELDFVGCWHQTSQLLDASTEKAELLKPSCLLLRGQIAAAESQWPEVREAMRELVTQYPHFSQRPVAQFWIAESYYRQQDWDAALDALQQVVLTPPAGGSEQTLTDGDGMQSASAGPSGSRDSWLAMVPLRIAQIHAHRGLWHDARRIAETVLRDYPDFSQRDEVEYLLGRCAMADADFDEARNAFGRVADSASGTDSETSAMAEWMIGETYLHQRDYEQALRQYLRVTIHSKFPRWQAAGLLQAGKCHEALDDRQSAIEVYGRLIEQFSNTSFCKDAQQRLEALAIPKARHVAQGG